MRKVLVVAPYPYLPYFSGGQKFIANFLDYLAKQTDLTVVTAKGTDTSLVTGYTCLPILKSSFSRYMDLTLVKKITTLVKDGKFDTVIWEHPYFGWLARRVKNRTGTTSIIHTHNIEHKRFRSTGRWWWPVLKKYEQAALKNADALFFITKEDMAFAVDEWSIQENKCKLLPFGISLKENPVDRLVCRELISGRHQIPLSHKLLLFNGLLEYKPNLDALKIILDQVNPLLQAQLDFRYTIIICGKGLPGDMNSLLSFNEKNIIYAGFVDDIDTYFKAADVFLNPVTAGGGIKTKMVEAIAFGTTVVSTESGAAGIEKELCGSKLITVADDNWVHFSAMVMQASLQTAPTPARYYDYYYWENIISRVL